MSEKIPTNVKWYDKFSYSIVTFTEYFFYNLGFKVASKPWTTIGICWLIVILSAFGFFRFHQEKNPMKLWVPAQSDFYHDTNWLMSKFQNGFRLESVLFEAPDVLTPEVLKEILGVDRKIKSIVTSDGVTWEDICFKIPEVDSSLEFLYTSKSKNGTMEIFDPSVYLSTSTYCKLLESFDNVCFERNLLQLWNFDERKLNKLTKQDILDKIDKYKIDPILGNLKNYEDLLGGIVRNETGHIVSATSLHTLYMAYVNFSAVDMDQAGNMAGTADWASLDTLEWENGFNALLEDITKNGTDLGIYYSAARSFGDLTAQSMFQDMDILVIGVGIMIFYVQFVISKFNCVEARFVLGYMGLLSVGMAFIVGCGFCSLVGISYGPVHTSLPFLLMGLGVDDMFVITACWEELVSESKLSLEQRIGYMLKHAGVSITVTTLTDVMAFLIGSSTILPSLQSYCLFAAAGVFMTFVFVITFFIACFTLDQKRIYANRNGALFCYTHKNHVKNECSQRKISNSVFRFIYSKIIFTLPGKIIVILTTVIYLGFSIESTIKLEQRFDPQWFIPQSTHLHTYLKKRIEHYPTAGHEAGVYFGSLNYSSEIHNIRNIVRSLEDSPDIIENLQSWVDPFRDYVKTNFKKDMFKETLSNSEFNLFLSKFLFSPNGARFQANFRFTHDLECGIPTTSITMSSVNFRLRHFDGSKQYLPAMHRATEIAKNNNFTSGDRFATVWSKIFATWVTDELIDVEVLRNLQLALLCVMICTVVLVANLQICFWIFICVLLTMVNVCGFMQRWGITLDMVSCIALELAIGLCVDYASHIGHTFLTIQEGSLEERSLRTVVSIGSAVLYGAFSTFIGVSMLSFSQAYTFQVFFKIFSLVVLFGMFHGVVLLPVILSFVGPKPYFAHKLISQSNDVI
uniref:SSD domain-containing protein n=1 Tax=Photinus pyralis TaxID=7054 RepID=A0A1Y1JZP0_PHOPY